LSPARRQRRSPPRSTPFPYTTLFRSQGTGEEHRVVALADREGAAELLLGQGPQDHADDGGRHGEAEAAHQEADEADRVEGDQVRSEEHTSELQSREKLVCRLLPEKKK